MRLPYLLIHIYHLFFNAKSNDLFLDGYKQDENLNGTRCESSLILFENVKAGLAKCAIGCRRNPECTEFIYNPIDKTCIGCRESGLKIRSTNSRNGNQYYKGPLGNCCVGSQLAWHPSFGNKNGLRFVGDWFMFEGHAYRVSEEKMVFSKASDYCRSYGGFVARIDSDRKSAFIRDRAWNYNTVWIGLTDEEEEGTWRWVHGGDRATYTDWKLSNFNPQPDGGLTVNCACIILGYGYQWADRICGKKFYVLCEK